MKNTILFVLMYIICLGSVNSQTRESYIFDNFTTAARIGANLKNTPPSTVKLAEKTFIAASKGLGAYTTGDTTIDSYIAESSARYNIDPLLIYAQMHQESKFKRRATSYKGASGLMQLMPATAMRFGVRNIYDPKQNIDAGIKYMRWLMDKFNGEVQLALAGYNAGEGAVMKYGNQIPPFNETRQYVKKITAHYNSIKKPNSVRTESNVLQQNLAHLEVQQPSASSSTFARNALTVLLSNGQTRLTNF
jgi:soluble lytic murein transglycosylase-like protein